jgi:hypothetical protein
MNPQFAGVSAPTTRPTNPRSRVPLSRSPSPSRSLSLSLVSVASLVVPLVPVAVPLELSDAADDADARPPRARAPPPRARRAVDVHPSPLEARARARDARSRAIARDAASRNATRNNERPKSESLVLESRLVERTEGFRGRVARVGRSIDRARVDASARSTARGSTRDRNVDRRRPIATRRRDDAQTRARGG